MQTSPVRMTVAFASVALLLLVALFAQDWGGVRANALVEAAHTFTIEVVDVGQYRWTLASGRPARGNTVLRQRSVVFDRADLVEIRLADGLGTGDAVAADQVLALLHSVQASRGLEELRAERARLESERALLAAGGTVQEVREAESRIRLAEALRESGRPDLERLRALAGSGVAPQAELQTAELLDQVRRLEIDLARAQLDVARGGARDEALAAIDAEIRAVDAEIAQLEDLIAGERVASPVAGVLELGGDPLWPGVGPLLRVYDLTTVYLRVPIPEADRFLVTVGDVVRFEPAALPGTTVSGTLVEIGGDAAPLAGRQVFWASVEVANADGRLRPGMSGTAHLDVQGWAPLTRLRQWMGR